VCGECNLLEVVAATHPRRRFANLLHGGEQQTDKDGDNCNHHQQFDEREGVPAHYGRTSHDELRNVKNEWREPPTEREVVGQDRFSEAARKVTALSEKSHELKPTSVQLQNLCFGLVYLGSALVCWFVGPCSLQGLERQQPRFECNQNRTSMTQSHISRLITYMSKACFGNVSGQRIQSNRKLSVGLGPLVDHGTTFARCQ
jgi:hypothetical protein